MEIDVPHHRHTDLAAHIQQAAGIVQILLLDADDVAVLIVYHALAVDGTAPGHHIKAHGLEVVDLAIHLVGAVATQLVGDAVNVVAQQNAAQLNAQLVGQLAALGDQFESGVQGDFILFK